MKHINTTEEKPKQTNEEFITQIVFVACVACTKVTSTKLYLPKLEVLWMG